MEILTLKQSTKDYVQSNKLTLTYKNTLNIFKEVLNNSAEYWNVEGANPTTRGWYGIKKSSWVILADAAGAAIGTAAAGVGSIILGAAWSVVMNESNQNEISADGDRSGTGAEYIVTRENNDQGGV